MAYRLRVGESVPDGIRRVISEQIERSLGELADADLGPADAIHQVRKRCKKIRAALRLVRGALGNAYSTENAWYRDVARGISDLRDAEAMIETCDALAKRFVDQVDGGVLRPIRGMLEARKKTLMGDTNRVDSLLHDFESAMAAGHERAASLVLEGDGCEVVLAGMRNTYARARAAMGAAYDNSTPETFHEWRKYVARIDLE
jgi:CHAD domain-containing protein